MRAPSEEVHTVKCAMCGILKGKSNRWFKATAAGSAQNETGMLIVPMGADLGSFTWALCGEGCLQTLVAEWASEVYKAEPPVKTDAIWAAKETALDLEYARQTLVELPSGGDNDLEPRPK